MSNRSRCGPVLAACPGAVAGGMLSVYNLSIAGVVSCAFRLLPLSQLRVSFARGLEGGLLALDLA